MIKRRTTLNIADNSGALTVQVQCCTQPAHPMKRIDGSAPFLFELQHDSLFIENQNPAQSSLTYSEFIAMNEIERFELGGAANRFSNDRYIQPFPFQLNYGNRLP